MHRVFTSGQHLLAEFSSFIIFIGRYLISRISTDTKKPLMANMGECACSLSHIHSQFHTRSNNSRVHEYCTVASNYRPNMTHLYPYNVVIKTRYNMDATSMRPCAWHPGGLQEVSTRIRGIVIIIIITSSSSMHASRAMPGWRRQRSWTSPEKCYCHCCVPSL